LKLRLKTARAAAKSADVGSDVSLRRQALWRQAPRRDFSRQSAVEDFAIAQPFYITMVDSHR
jgi:hypothetical protein